MFWTQNLIMKMTMADLSEKHYNQFFLRISRNWKWKSYRFFSFSTFYNFCPYPFLCLFSSLIISEFTKASLMKKNHLISRLSLFQSERRHSAVYFIWNDQVTVRVQVRGQIVNACHLISDVLLHVNFSYLWCSVAASPCFVPSSPPPPLQAAPFQPWAARASFKAAST